MRLVLDWFSIHQVKNHPLNFPESAKWFSEALLPSQFKPRLQKDHLGESRTHADGAIGHFLIGEQGKADLSLHKNASHLVIIEAKIFSKLSQGVTNAKYFNQAARTVACIAEILGHANIPPQKIKTGFYILAPESQISSGIFNKEIQEASILKTVNRRVAEYGGEKDQWLADWFEPTLKNITLGCLSWEKIIAEITMVDPALGIEIDEFYQHCIQFNGKI